MAIKVDDYLAKLPKKRQQAIAKRAAELITEEATLHQLRVAREQSQEEPRRARRVEPRDCHTEDQRGSDMPDNQGRGVGLGTRERRG